LRGVSIAEVLEAVAGRFPDSASPSHKPFDREWVTLTKREHIELVMQAKQWKSLHERAVRRLEFAQKRHQFELAQARQREDRLKGELEAAQAQIRDLRQRVFGAKTEQSDSINALIHSSAAVGRPRGHQRGRPGHGRTRLARLPAKVQELTSQVCCPRCGLGLVDFAGTQDAEVLEIEVKAYRRIVRRHRYRPQCRCGCLPGIVTAPPPAQLIARGKLGVSIWVEALLSKFVYGQPSARLLQDWNDLGLNISQGTLTDGLRRLLPMFAPLAEAGLAQLRRDSHWHADETRWEVFAQIEGKVGHRWYLWVFKSATVVCFVLDPSRSAKVPGATLQGVSQGILSVDRYAAYRKFARLSPGVSLSICWAHQRRDFLRLANDHPALWDWAMGWVEQIAQLYRLHALRREHYNSATDQAAFIASDVQLRELIGSMAIGCQSSVTDEQLAAPARKVLRTMRAYWPGLVLFLNHPWLDLDNNASERALRPAVVGRKNFYGSGSPWSGQLAATMMSLLNTVKMWGLNPRLWLASYLQACAQAGGRAPDDWARFVPWQMDVWQLAAMRSATAIATIDSS
jgi:transposase